MHIFYLCSKENFVRFLDREICVICFLRLKRKKIKKQNLYQRLQELKDLYLYIKIRAKELIIIIFKQIDIFLYEKVKEKNDTNSLQKDLAKYILCMLQ